MAAITAAHEGDIQMIDSTSVRAHQQAATARRGIEIIVSVDHEAGSRQKIHAVVDAQGLTILRQLHKSGREQCPIEP